MTLPRTMRLVCLLLIATACLPLFLSGEMPPFLWTVVFPGLALGYFTGGNAWPKYLVVIVTTALIASLAFLVLVSVQSGDWLVNSITFALLATVTRTLQLQTSRQAFQAVGLSFLMLIAAAVTNPDVSFAIFFVVYAVLLTWALTYTHLTQQVEESPQTSGLAWKAARLVSRKFLAASSLLALGLLLTSMVFFFLFPRLGLGFFSARTRSGDPLVGFSDSVELGHFGTLSDSSRVVLRVEFREGKEFLNDAMPFRFRGMAFDHYDGKAWARTLEETSALRAGGDGFCEVWGFPAGPGINYDMIEYDIYQEPLEVESRVLFGLDRPLEFKPALDRFDRYRGFKRNYYVDELLNLGYSDTSMTSLAYAIRTGLLRVSDERLRSLPARYPKWARDAYLQVPDDLDARVAPLAREALGDAKNVFDAAKNIEHYLSSRYGYTKEGAGAPEDPLADFLFVRKEGHCQYFATAMVVMLRKLGVPARPVNGFLGADYNEFGDYYSVTESRAHTWVEVLFPKYGWIVFDPTPAQEDLMGEAGVLDELDQWLDSVKLAWYKWVIEYDLERQIALYTGVWNALAPKSKEVDFSPEMNVFEMRAELRKISKTLFSRESAVAIAALLLVLLAAKLAVRLLRRRRVPSQDEIRKLADLLRHVMRRKGLSIPPGTTLPAVARLSLASGFPASASVAALADLIEEARFGPRPSADLPRMRRLLREVRKQKAREQAHP